MIFTMTVNGAPRTLDVQTHRTLLEALRDQLNLTGTKECCAEGECGACTVLLNGRAVNACLVLAVECDGETVVTIEGLGAGGRLDAVQQATQDVPPQPLLYLHGAGDGCIGVEVAETARTMVPDNVTVEIVDGGGHFLHLEQPAEVNRRVVGFLTS